MWPQSMCKVRPRNRSLLALRCQVKSRPRARLQRQLHQCRRKLLRQRLGRKIRLNLLNWAETLRSQLRSAGFKGRGFPCCINYGIEVDGDFIPLLSVSATNMWFPIPMRAVRVLGDERFTACKQKINSVAAFYRPEDVSDPTKTKHSRSSISSIGRQSGSLCGSDP